MKALLINLKFETGHVSNFRQQEHLGMGYIAAVARQNGFDADVLNAQYLNINLDKVQERLLNEKPDVVGFTIYEEQLDEVIGLTEFIKKELPDTTIVAGGHYASFNAENLLKNVNTIDLVVIGEAEQSFSLILTEIQEKGYARETKGIFYRKDDEVISTGWPKGIRDLDELPYPVRSNTDRRDNITNISTSRGCHGNCSFCSTNAFNRTHRHKLIRIRNPKKVVDEIEYLVNELNAYHIFITDDNFMANELLKPGWIDEFVNEIKAREIDIVFNFDCRVDDLDAEPLAKLKSVGLIGVFLGVESNSSATLELYNKQTTGKQNVDAIKQLKKLRIDYWVGNIMFHPTTILDDIEADLNFYSEIKYWLYFNYSNPVSCLAGRLKIYRGTPLFNKMNDRNIFSGDNPLLCQYEFQDKKTAAYYDFVQAWKKIIEPIVELDPIYLLEVANRNKELKKASKIHALSRKYMKLDFLALKETFYYLKENSLETFNEQIDRQIKEKEDETREIFNQLSAIRNDLLKLKAS